LDIRLYSHIHLYSFFFQSSGTHLVLHSFPTRRSSDLVDDKDVHTAPQHCLQRREQIPLVDVPAVRRQVAPRAPDGDRVDVHRMQDRKSTRLNSSHSQISYAVFCLKKKKKKKTHTSNTR